MKAKRAKGPKEFDIVSLVDIVFLLIIFGLVVTAIEIVHGSARGTGDEGETLQLTFKRMSKPPDHINEVAVIATRSGVTQSCFFPPDQQILTMPDGNWNKQEAVAFIHEKIAEFAAKGPVSHPIIVEAEEDIPFRVVALVPEECSKYGKSMSQYKIALLNQGEDQEQ
jgi:hypothetical protein